MGKEVNNGRCAKTLDPQNLQDGERRVQKLS
jgi:hypothetical protein